MTPYYDKGSLLSFSVVRFIVFHRLIKRFEPNFVIRKTFPQMVKPLRKNWPHKVLQMSKRSQVTNLTRSATWPNKLIKNLREHCGNWPVGIPYQQPALKTYLEPCSQLLVKLLRVQPLNESPVPGILQFSYHTCDKKSLTS